MKHWLSLGTLWASLLLTVAQSMAATVPMPPKPDFSAMRFLLGNWSCTHVSTRRREPTFYTERWEIDPSGYWMNETLHVKPRPVFPYASTGLNRFTYDSDLKRWISVYTDTLGNYDLAVSTGWHNGRVVWVSQAPLPPGIAKMTEDLTVKAGPAKMVRTYGVIPTGGKKVTVTQTCRKTS